jgi:type IV pilus assembly protein PilN
MARINLLPWREEQREQRQKEFIVAIAAGVLITVILFYIGVLFVNSMLDDQNDRNRFLGDQIALLDDEIKEISTLEQERDRLLARMQVIQELQTSRPKVVRILDSLARIVPEGVYLQKVARVGEQLTFNGVAQSNARVSVFMRQIDDDAEFDESKLQVIQRAKAAKNFTLGVKESKPKNAEGEL